MATTNPNDYYKVKTSSGYDIYDKATNNKYTSDQLMNPQGTGFIVNVDHIPVGSVPITQNTQTPISTTTQISTNPGDYFKKPSTVTPGGFDIFDRKTGQQMQANQFETAGAGSPFSVNVSQIGLAPPSSADIKNALTSGNSKMTSSTGLTVSNSSNNISNSSLFQNPPAITTGTETTAAAGTATANGISDITAKYDKAIADAEAKQKALEDKASSGLTGLFSGAPAPIDKKAIHDQTLTDLGLPADFQKTEFGLLSKTGEELIALNQQLNNLDIQSQTAQANISQQAIPMESINAQSIQAERLYAIKKAGIASDISAKTAYANFIQGQYNLATQAIDKAVEQATAQKTQEINDYKWMFSNYKSEYDKLSTQEQTLNDNLITTLKEEKKQTQEDLRYKLNLFINNKVAPPDMKTIDSMTTTEVAQYVSQHMPVTGQNTSWQDKVIGGQMHKVLVNDVTGATIKDLGVSEVAKVANTSTNTLSILDVQRYNELYPNAKVMPGDTKSQADAKVATTNTPEANIKNLITSAKDNGNTYDVVVNEINGDTTIKDKAGAIAIAKEIYGVTETPSSSFKLPDLGKINPISSIYNYLFK